MISPTVRGWTPATFSRLVELGILTPEGRGTFPSGDVPRADWCRPSSGQVCRSTDRRRHTERRPLVGVHGPALLRAVRLAEQCDLRGALRRVRHPIELLIVVREAIGFGQPLAGDRVREDELRIASVIERLLELGSRPAVVEWLLRVRGESLRRIAEMEGHWWHTEVEIPLLETGMGEREMMEASNRLSPELASLQERAVLEIDHAQHEHSGPRTSSRISRTRWPRRACTLGWIDSRASASSI
jgi:hypothetical protein